MYFESGLHLFNTIAKRMRDKRINISQFSDDLFDYCNYLFDNDLKNNTELSSKLSYIFCNYKKEHYNNLFYSVFKDINNIETHYDYIIHEQLYLMYNRNNYSLDFIKFLDSLEGVYDIYFLYSENKKLLYIGKSINVSNRICKSIHDNYAKFAKVKFPNSLADMTVYELYYINYYKPLNNIDSLFGDGLTIQLPNIKFSTKKYIEIFK